MNMPFSRPGAIDLSSLKRPAPQPAGRPAAGGPSQSQAASYAVEVDEQNFQTILESSMSAPVVLVVYSPSRMPESAQLAEDFSTLAGELDGRIAVGRVNVDAQPGIAQAMQVQALPLVAMVLQGRLQPLFQDAPPMSELRPLMSELLQQLAQQGMTGRHQPFDAAPAPEAEEPQADPRYAAADDALVSGELDTAIAEYQKLVDANPADAEAALGLARAQLMKRTSGVDLATARQAAAEAPDDVAAQIMVADLDLLGGHVEDAFLRLIELVRRTAGDDRDRARVHLIGMFAVVGNDDPRVLKGRQSLASALF